MPMIQGHRGTSDEAPKQFNQPSRKGKKAWRKNVDVTEVEDGLKELNNEIISGGVVKERDSADLFTLDTSGDANIPKKFPKYAQKKLKADEIIAQRSAVPAVSMRKRPSSKTTDGLLPVKRQRKDWVSHKELSRLKQVADGHHDGTVEVKDAAYDIWDAPANNKSTTDDDSLAATKQVKAPDSMKQKPISLLSNGKQAPAVQKPTGGYSYNPVFSDYEERLKQYGAKAVDAERKRLAEEEEERLKQEAVERSKAEAEAAEARANLSEWEEDSEWEGFQSGVEDNDRPSTKRPGRKTQTQRNKAARRKEEERLAKHKAAMKARRAQEQRISQIAEEFSELDRNKQLMATEGQGDSEDSDVDLDQIRRKQLGKYKLPENDLELVLPDELQESLRLLKPEGNLLKDRYRNMLIRGKVETRRHLPFKKQAKKKYTEKWQHKDFVL